MKYSDAVKNMLFTSINTLISNPENYAVCPEKDFSRNRKLGAKDLILLLLTMEADCIKEELYRYFGRTTNAPSKAAFYKQRQKLKDDALRSLLISFNRKCKKHLLKENIPSLHAMAHQRTFLEIQKIRIPSLSLMESLRKGLIKFISMLSFPFWIKNLLI